MSLPTLTELGASHGFTSGDLQTTGQIAVMPAFQKVWFADGRPYDASINDSGYHKLDFINTRLVGEVTGSFTNGEVITQASSGAKGVFDETVGTGATAWHLVYRTTTVEFETGNAVLGADSGASVTPTSVVAPPHWCNWTLTDGSFPDGGSNIMALAFNRIFMNSMYNPHQWFATRAGDPLDMLMSQSDVGTATSSQTSKAGIVGDELVALIPYKDYYLIFGLLNEMWVLRSDPEAGGVFTNIARKTGIFSSKSFCWDDKNNLYFAGTDGIYGITPEAIMNAMPPTNLTKQHIPKLMASIGLNRRTDRIVMEYDKDRYGILVSISQMDGAWSTCFWLDLRSLQFKPLSELSGMPLFPEIYQDDHIPASIVYFNSRRSDQRGLICGGYDGYVRKFSESDKSDDGDNAIESFVTIGPISDKETPRIKMTMNELSITTGLNTDVLEVSLYLAKTSEQLINNIINGVSPNVSKTFSHDKLLPSLKQKISGGAIGFTLGNTSADSSWSIEKISAKIKISGKEK